MVASRDSAGRAALGLAPTGPARGSGMLAAVGFTAISGAATFAALH